MIKINWMFWHRWIGLFTCLGVLMWGISGISHPIMTRLQPKPVAFSAPTAQFDLSNALSLQKVLEKHHIVSFFHISLAQFSGKSFYRVAVTADKPARYFEMNTGEELVNADAAYAKSLAMHFTGNNISSIANVELITEFSDDYHAVNRLLPVWRVSFNQDGNLRAFIDTEQTRLSTLVDDKRFWLTKLFEFGHNWSFLQSAPKLQITLAGIILCAVLASAFSGIYLYFKLGNHLKRLEKQPIKRWHRRIGLLVSLAAIIFATSGFFHLLMSYIQQQNVLKITPQPIHLHQINDDAWQALTKKTLAKLDLISHAGIPYWYVLEAAHSGENQMPIAQVAALAKEQVHAEHHQHSPKELTMPYIVRADTTSKIPSGKEAFKSVENVAKLQVVSLAHRPLSEIVSTTWVTQFAKEYGFIFKRLPVIKVQLNDEDHTRYYIEPATGALSVKVRDIDGLEGFIFAYLHKWAFESFNKDLRDFIVALFALLNIIVGALGLNLFIRQKRY